MKATSSPISRHSDETPPLPIEQGERGWGEGGSSGLLYWLVPAALCLAVGCSNPAEPMGKVFGRVTLQEQPLGEGSIIFTNAEKGVYITAALQHDGSYEVESSGGRGLPLGNYRVYLAPAPGEPLTKANPVPKARPGPAIPARYRDAKSSGLKLEVKEGDNPFDVKLQP